MTGRAGPVIMKGVSPGPSCLPPSALGYPRFQGPAISTTTSDLPVHLPSLSPIKAPDEKKFVGGKRKRQGNYHFSILAA